MLSRKTALISASSVEYDSLRSTFQLKENLFCGYTREPSFFWVTNTERIRMVEIQCANQNIKCSHVGGKGATWGWGQRISSE